MSLSTKVISFLLFYIVIGFSEIYAQEKKNVQQTSLDKYDAINRTITAYSGEEMQGIALDAREEYGLVWLKETIFSEGTIEFDVMGENKPTSSFVGIAFHGMNDSTFDCIYFRPFNFVAEKQINRDHMVQYVSLPDFDWSRLREEKTGQFEKEILNAPDPTKWFHARIEVKGDQVSVFVNKENKPSLVVTKLNNRKSGKIGFWAGFNSSARFANLKLSKH